MEITSSVYDILSAAIIFTSGALISAISGKKFGVGYSNSLILYFWHTSFSLFYCWYVLGAGGDALSYFRWGQLWAGELGVGTSAVRAIAGILVTGLGLSLLGTFLVFNIFGQIGLLALWGCLRKATIGKTWQIRMLGTLIVFLPSVSFWSAAIGKDAIAFMATGLALWSSLNLSRRSLLMTLSIGTMFIVRPHMAGIMVMAIVVAALADSRASVLKKMMLGAFSLGVAAVLVPFALRYAGIGGVLTAELLAEYIDERQSYNVQGGGGVDIASMSLPMQLFTYLFRPVLFEAGNLFELAAALDNFILLMLFILGGFGILRGRKSELGENRMFMWTYAVGAWLVLAMTTANLGIALRQKWMFAPMLIFLFISVMGRRRDLRSNQS